MLWFLAAWMSAGHAYPSGADVAEIREVIHRQIDALRRDDAPAAFALVSPNAQAEFGTPERFVQAVLSSCRPVYQPLRVAFVGLVVLGEEVIQEVRLTDPAGAPWLAYYSMERQSDGRWRMNACHVMQPARTIPA